MNSSLTSVRLPTETLNQQSTPAASGASPIWCYAVLVLLIVLFGLVRYRLRDMPLERDEGEYAYAGQLLLQGIPPYQIAYNMKLPGTYVAYAAIMAVFGETAPGIHLGLLVVNAITTWLIFLLARKFFGARNSLVAAACYALLSTSPAVLGLEGHATHFVVLFAIAGLIVLLKAIEKNHALLTFCAGLLLGLSFLMKQPGIFFPVFGLLYLIYRQQTRTNRRDLLSLAGSYIAGAVLPFALTCLVLYRLGVFHKFWFWTFSYAKAYVTSVSLRQGLEYFRANALTVVRPALFVWMIALAGLVCVAWDSKARRNFCYAFFLFSFLAVCPGVYFRPHYFIVLLPAASLSVAECIEFTQKHIRTGRLGRFATALPALVIGLAFAGTLFTQREFLFILDPVSACRGIYPKEPFPELVHVAQYIRSQTPNYSSFELLGADPQTYFYANRRSVSGFMYIYPLTEDQPYALPMQKELISKVEAARPQFIVWVYDWDIPRGPRQLLILWMGQYLRTNYDAVSVIMQPDSETHATGEASGETPMIAVFKRRG